MKKKVFFLGRGIFSAVIIIGLIFGTLPEAKAAPYFEGKVITFVVGFGAGGGTDIFGRLLSRHIGKFLPGEPSVVVRNMSGAQGMIAANYVYKAGKLDGRTVLVTTGSNVMANILRPKGVVHEFQKMHPIYSSPLGSIAVFKPGLVKEPKDIMKAKGLIFGHTGATGGSGSIFLWARELLGFDVEKWVWGYDGSSASRQAFLSGEINSNATTTISYHGALKSFVDKGEVAPIFQSGILDENGNVVRESGAPDVPTAAELYEQIYGKKPSGLVWEAYKLVVGQATFGKCLLLPTKVPTNIVEMWRKAAIEMSKDPKFLKEASKLMPGAPHFVGKALARNYPAGVSGPPEVIEFMRKLLTDKHSVVFD